MTNQKQAALSASEFISFIESGDYKKMKQTEVFLKQAKGCLREMLTEWEGKRHEFKDLNMVAKFVPKKVFETDHSGLIEELLCYVQHDFISPLIRLEPKAIKENEIYETLREYLLPKTFYVRPTLNKVGKMEVSLHDYIFGGQTEKELIAEIKETSLQYKQHETHYEHFKTLVQNCPVLQAKKKVATPYGSVSLIPHKEKWDLPKIYKDYGEEYLIQYGNVDTAKLDELILQGAIPKSIVSNHRKVTDIRLDFMVMELDTEERILSFQRNKKVQASLRRFA